MEFNGQVLLINPWIYDFAAHNLWIEPLGLLTIAAALVDNGYRVTVVDCLAPHPGAPRSRPDGSGKFAKQILDKPGPVAHVPRRFGRYGLPLDQFQEALDIIPPPDAVLVASGMTYWYPGVIEAIRQVRARWGAVPVALGGIYATLCPDHARQFSGTDLVIQGAGMAPALQFVAEAAGRDPAVQDYAHPATWPPAAHHLVPRPYAGIVTSWGCPFRCTYCASHRLQPSFIRRDPDSVVQEILACARRGIHDLAFYDDALLVDAEQHIIPILKGVLEGGIQVRFHTPNGLHAGAITAELASLMRRAGFATIRLSLETVDVDRQRATGGKVTTAAFEEAVANLRDAGFGSQQLGAYILAGLPGAPLSETERTVRFAHSLGVQARLALFSPIPGTPEGDRALPSGTDPLLHNNTAYPYLLGGRHMGELQRLKQLAKDGNTALTQEQEAAIADR